MAATDDVLRPDDPSAVARRPGVLARLRAAVRAKEVGLIGLALVVGVVGGLLTVGLARAAAALHTILFDLRERPGALSSLDQLSSPWFAFVPVVGGLMIGVTGWLITRWRPRRPVDPIEANALHGGRLSALDSAIIGAQTLVSNGFGASVGLEAGYTQLGSGFASWLGRSFNLRRADMRMMVGAGAAAAIAAAFNGPLTGTFYAFELIIGTYTPFGLAPVIAAAIVGVLVARTIGTGESFIGEISSSYTLGAESVIALLLLSLACAAIGIGVMRGVTLTESLFKRSHLPSFLRPALGGLCLGVMALITPHVLSSGHGALADLLHTAPPALSALALTMVLKSFGSAISIGSGFRGGLFFASLYLGGLVGKLFYAVVTLLIPTVPIDGTTCAIVGMAGMSVTIIGGPLTMSFLALETTGDFPLSILVLAATTLVSVIVRRTFGYSFATWRLHLRGESIRSAQDVGWVRTLTVGSLMQRNIETTFADSSIRSFLENHPLGTDYWVIATDPFDRYAGMISLNEAHTMSPNAEKCRGPVTSLLRHTDTVLTPDINIQQAARIFERSESEALAVVESATNRRVVGLLTEAHVLRRYTAQLDSVRKDLSGEAWIGER